MMLDEIEILRKDLLNSPSASLILAARCLSLLVPVGKLPTWVDVMAGGDLSRWQSVIEVAKEFMDEEVKYGDQPVDQ
jgi:hypothetical protein